MNNIILDYCVSLVNLYGIVSLDRIVHTYNLQNEDQISLGDLKDEVEKNEDYLRDNLVIVENNELVAIEIIMLGDYDKEKGYKENKPYYIPERAELLKYRDYTYFERTCSYKELVEFFEGLYKDISRAEELANEVRIFIRSADGMKNLGYFFEESKLKLKDIKDAEKLMELIGRLSNNTRMWANNGFTPIEIEEMDGES
ncbi:hypothetical protein [Gudongella sp. SC589]|jgi:hypothetical protein|uniref:hypothetical protein n=1 Tax=Gudongella sp. SC589 TaxID=3385990 RepID=UPI003904A1B9